MKSLVKGIPVQVGLSEEEARDLDRLVAIQRRDRKTATIGRATVLRELGMDRVRELLAGAQRAAA